MSQLADTALILVKQRLNRLPGDRSLDDYLGARIDAAVGELARSGIHLADSETEDVVLLCDFVVWQYQNRDVPTGMPEWLRLRRRERFLQDRRGRNL